MGVKWSKPQQKVSGVGDSRPAGKVKIAVVSCDYLHRQLERPLGVHAEINIILQAV